MTLPGLGVGLVLVTTLLEGIGQVALKKSVLPAAVRRLRWLLLGVAALALEAVVYTRALACLDVSVAYAVSSFSLVSVALLSWWRLGERMTGKRWGGVALIFAGVVLVAWRR